MSEKKRLEVGVGFATGRKSFQKVLKSYIYNWQESGLVSDDNISLNVFIAYDLDYNKTSKHDYHNIHPELVENLNKTIFIGKNDLHAEIKRLTNEGILEPKEAQKIFGRGYASQRNAILYNAIKHNMDYLIFLDDDEYPVAVTNNQGNTVWHGQHVLSTHIQHLKNVDLTHGYHCGYISPIPFIEYNNTLTEADFRSFIEAISNDILNWDCVRSVMENGGITYANAEILTRTEVTVVQEVNHAKFISGSNLGINLTEPQRVFPFYNPVGARGEDTFLSTCLRERQVLKVPCYTFHDGFSTYNHLLSGVLPTQLKFTKADNDKIINRFYKACIGWIRYKPLLLYVSQPNTYTETIKEMHHQLSCALPKICNYFGRSDFENILLELEKYDRNVKKHYIEFIEVQNIWKKYMLNSSSKSIMSTSIKSPLNDSKPVCV